MPTSLKHKFVWGVILIIAPVLTLLFAWLSFRMINQGKDETLEKARVVAHQIILTRKWITDCMGGVFVNKDSQGAAGMNFILSNRIETPDGIFQQFSPAMVTKKLSEYSFREKAYNFSLTSLEPINLENSPDAFEKEALNHFDGNTDEFFAFSEDVLDYMVPLYRTEGCLKCHKGEGAAKAGIIGGLRVTIPFRKVKDAFKRNALVLALSGCLITCITILVLIFYVRNLVLTPLRELDEKSRLLSTGKLDTRVSMKTGDELERLGNTFNAMAHSLMLHRDELEQRVASATRDLARANHELLKLDKLKSDFLANMSHELRTPLTAVKGSIHFLERTVTDPQSLDYIHIIEKNISRLTRLISNLFDFTKLEAGKIEWEFEHENITELVKDVIEIMSPVSTEKNIAVTLKSPPDVFAFIDLERIEQVLVNLLDNAIKYSKPSTTVQIEISESDHDIEILVRDQGPGIDAKNLDTIFEKFYTGDSDNGEKQHGAGMGLAISKAIITAHRGTITVASNEKTGTIFRIFLPSKKDQGVQ